MKMGYFVVGTNNFDASLAFYDGLFESSPMQRVMTNERMAFWQGEDMNSAFAVALPFDGAPATNGNGTMLGFSVGSAEEVKRLHQKAIALGGTCEGEPNQRGPRYSAYVRDLDKNKLCFYP